jgi:hypothetical protein
MEFKKSFVVGHDRAVIFEGRAFENDGGARNDGAAHIGYGADHTSWLRLGGIGERLRLTLRR